MRKIGITVAAFALAAFLPVSAHADIINLSPDGDSDIAVTCTGVKGNAAEELAFAESCGGTFDLTLGFGSDGSAAEFTDDYTYTPNADNSGGTLVWDGGTADSFTCPTCILVVADGNNEPIYGFNLGDWDGGVGAGQVITLSSFYDETQQASGGISHVKIYFGPGTSGGGGSTGGGGGSTGVPEPTSLALFGVAALALAARVRRQRRVTA